MFQRQKQSPYSSVQFCALQQRKQAAIRQVEMVFTHFAGRGSKYNYQELNEKYFMQLAERLFTLAGLQGELSYRSQRWLSLSTLFYTKGRSKPLYFSQFLQLLPALARVLYLQPNAPVGGREQEKATRHLLELFEKMYRMVMEQQVGRRGLCSQQIVQQTKQFLLKLRQSLTKLYKANLKDKGKDYQMRSFQNLLEIMRDFDVYPKLISASQLYYVYREVLDERHNHHLTLLQPSIHTKAAFPKLGECFTLTRFVLALVLASHVCVSKLKRVEGEELLFSATGLTQKEGIKLLLEYMETMRSGKEKYCKFSKERLSLIVYEEYAEYTGQRASTQSSPGRRSSPGRSRVSGGVSEQKKSFFDILNSMDM